MQNKCGAKTRSGKPCQNAPVAGRNRCRMHGGRQPRANDNPNFKHGLYSKHAGQSLKKVIAELEELPSEEIINTENEIRLMQALIIESKQLKEGINNLQSLEVITKIIDRLVSAKQRSQAINIEQQRLIPAKDVSKFLDYVESMLRKRMAESEASHLIDEFKNYRSHEN